MGWLTAKLFMMLVASLRCAMGTEDIFAELLQLPPLTATPLTKQALKGIESS